MKISDTYYVCRTGKLNQFFTLYIHRTINTKTFHNDVCYFVQNLAHDKDEAIAKAQSMMLERKLGRGKDYTQFMEFSDSKKREYCDLTIFGIGWRKTKKGFVVEMDHLTSDQRDDIWETWRKDKDALKEAGFSIFKGDSYANQWFFFFKNCTNDEMEQKLATFKLRKATKVVSGDFVGSIGDRIKVNTTLINTKTTETMYGRCQIMTFNDNLGNTLTSFYSGKKLAPKNNTEITLTGTVSKHQEFNGVNQTILKRITF